MAVSFDQARAIAETECRDQWESALGRRGTFHVADWGFEDADAFSMVVGARESIVDGEDGYVEYDAPLILVDKQTGELTRNVIILNLARTAEMTPVGPVPAEYLISAEDV